MTRIIAGEYGGRRLVVPAGRNVRPTADRVREAWLSIAGGRIDGASVLDLFAGSGALGLEALSRGAAFATFVDQYPQSIAAIRTNAAALGLGDRARVLRQDVFRFLAAHAAPADVAFADPPFDAGLAARLVAAFHERPFARFLGVEHPWTEQLEGGDTRRYGDIALTFFEAP